MADEDYAPTYEELMVALHNQLSGKMLPLPPEPGSTQRDRMRKIRAYVLKFAKEMSR